MSAPRYSFGKPTNGKRRHAKIHVLDVKEIRKWAGREGWGLTLTEQARQQQVRYPGLSLRALEGILANETWFDPEYDRLRPHPEWTEIPAALVLLILIRRMSASMGSSARLEVDRVEQAGLAKHREGVLDGAAAQPGVFGQRLGRPDVLVSQGDEYAASA